MRSIPPILLAVFAQALCCFATQWTVRSYAILSTYITRESFDPTFTFSDSTTIYLTSVSPTPTASPISSDVDILDDLDVTYITYYLPAGAVPQAVIASATRTDTTFTSSPFTYFYMPIEYTAPASCPTPFTYTTSTDVYIPSGAESLVTPTAVSTVTSGLTDIYVTAYLTPSAVSLETPPATTDFIYSDYIASCSDPATTPTYGYSYTYNPTATGSYTGSGGGSYYGGYSYDYYNNCLGSLCPFWLIYIIIFCTLIPLLFILGIFESYFWFSRLMKGRFAFRGVPLFWVCISLWTLLCLRRSRQARPEEQAQLEKEWRGLSTGRRLGLWMQYGFRHRNPPQLDAVRANQQPQQQQQQQMMYQAPPGQQPYYYQPGPQSYYPPPGQTGSTFASPPGGQFPMGQQQSPNLYPTNQMPTSNYPPHGPAGNPGIPMQQAYTPPPGQTGAAFPSAGGYPPQEHQQYSMTTSQAPTSNLPPPNPTDNPNVPIQQAYTPPPGQQAYSTPSPQQRSPEQAHPHFNTPPESASQPHSPSSQQLPEQRTRGLSEADDSPR